MTKIESMKTIYAKHTVIHECSNTFAKLNILNESHLLNAYFYDFLTNEYHVGMYLLLLLL